MRMPVPKTHAGKPSVRDEQEDLGWIMSAEVVCCFVQPLKQRPHPKYFDFRFQKVRWRCLVPPTSGGFSG